MAELGLHWPDSLMDAKLKGAVCFSDLVWDGSRFGASSLKEERMIWVLLHECYIAHTPVFGEYVIKCEANDYGHCHASFTYYFYVTEFQKDT